MKAEKMTEADNQPKFWMRFLTTVITQYSNFCVKTMKHLAPGLKMQLST